MMFNLSVAYSSTESKLEFLERNSPPVILAR